MAHRVSSSQRINSGAIGGIADMARIHVAHPGDANDQLGHEWPLLLRCTALTCYT
jgi:hypothetical protein